MPNYNISKFHPTNIQKNRMVLFVGKKGSGKTTLILDVFYHLRDRYDVVFGLAGTSASEDLFKKFIPESFIFPAKSEVIVNIVKMANILANKKKCRKFLIVLDDILACSSDNKKSKASSNANLLDHPIFKEIAYNGRHLNITIAISIQYCMALKIQLRSQVDYCFVFQEMIKANRKRLYEYFFGVFDSYEIFNQVLFNCTQNYECLVLDNVKNTGNLEDNIYFYKASTDIPQYKLGQPCFFYLTNLYKTYNKENTHVYEELMDCVNEAQKASNASKKRKADDTPLIIKKLS